MLKTIKHDVLQMILTIPQQQIQPPPFLDTFPSQQQMPISYYNSQHALQTQP